MERLSHLNKKIITFTLSPKQTVLDNVELKIPVSIVQVLLHIKVNNIDITYSKRYVTSDVTALCKEKCNKKVIQLSHLEEENINYLLQMCVATPKKKCDSYMHK
jgi:hypothetical protein